MALLAAKLSFALFLTIFFSIFIAELLPSNQNIYKLPPDFYKKSQSAKTCDRIQENPSFRSGFLEILA
jgi:hypothetical protein